MNRSLLALAQVSAALGVSLACYLVSAHVNAEHGAIDRLTRTIAQERRAVAMLGALYDARRAMPQVQRWSDADATRLMSAPAPEQMLASATQLAAFVPGRGGATATQAVVSDAPAPVPAPPVRAAVPAAVAVPVAARPAMIASQIAVPRELASANDAAPRSAGPVGPTHSDRARARARTRTDVHASIAERAAPRETGDLAALTRDIGRELRASDASPVRRVSLR